MCTTVLALACALLPGVAVAQSLRETREQIRSTMVLTGTIEIDAAGNTLAHAIDDSGGLPADVLAVVARDVPGFRFEPPGAPTRARMVLRMLSSRGGDGGPVIAIGAAHFGDDGFRDPDSIPAPVDRPAPNYPWRLFEAGATGAVYALMKIDRDGRVDDVVVEQVNLGAIGDSGQMKAVRRVLAANTVAALRQWTFRPPVRGDEVDDPYWVVRLPVAYCVPRRREICEPEQGRWIGYHPGPRAKPPSWVEPDPVGFAPDLLTLGEVYGAESRIRLLKPLAPPGAD